MEFTTVITLSVQFKIVKSIRVVGATKLQNSSHLTEWKLYSH